MCLKVKIRQLLYENTWELPSFSFCMSVAPARIMSIFSFQYKRSTCMNIIGVSTGISTNYYPYKRMEEEEL
jgi:hypothetical protein